jgi:20S proteasome alpha/beta subunit
MKWFLFLASIAVLFAYAECVSFDSSARLLQLEFASKAVESGGGMIGMRGQDGILLITCMPSSSVTDSKTDLSSSASKLKRLSQGPYIIASGLAVDVRRLEDVAFDFCSKHVNAFGSAPRLTSLADYLSSLVYERTLSPFERPLGAACYLLTHSEHRGFELIEVDHTGHYHQCLLTCIGGLTKGFAAAWPSSADPSHLPCEHLLPQVLDVWSKQLQEMDLELSDIRYRAQVLRADNVWHALPSDSSDSDHVQTVK